MSKTTPTELTQDTLQDMNKRFEQLSNEAKTNSRLAISQMQEIILNSFNQITQSLVMAEQERDRMNKEVERLRKLCDKNHIKHTQQ